MNMQRQLHALLLLAAIAVSAASCVAQQGGNVVLPSITIDSGSTQYQAPVSITNSGSFVVGGSASVSLTAGTSIMLEPGFEATAGTASVTFSALVEPSIRLSISGQVLVNGSALSGVTVSLSGTTSAGDSVSDLTVTDAKGDYVFAVLGGTYTITPSLSGYTFSPASQKFTSMESNQTATAISASLSAPSAPVIAGLSLPGGGPPQMSFVISGTNFGASQGSSTVTFNGVNLTVVSWSDISITVQIPPATASATGTITVTVGGQKATHAFSVTSPFGCS